MNNTNNTMLPTSNYYAQIIQSVFDHSLWKIIAAVLFSLFTVPIEFIIAIPIFWIMDFFSGLYAAKRKSGGQTWFSLEKMRGQFVKITIHIALLSGCVIIANLYGVDQFIKFGFGYVIANEFLFSTIPNLFGKKESKRIVKRLKEIFFNTLGINIDDDNETTG